MRKAYFIYNIPILLAFFFFLTFSVVFNSINVQEFERRPSKKIRKKFPKKFQINTDFFRIFLDGRSLWLPRNGKHRIAPLTGHYCPSSVKQREPTISHWTCSKVFFQKIQCRKIAVITVQNKIESQI